MAGWEVLISEPAADVSAATLAERLDAAVDMDVGARIEDGCVLSGWPDTHELLRTADDPRYDPDVPAEPQYDRLQSVAGLARACYVLRDDTAMSEEVAYFERVDGDLERVGLYGGHYGDGIEQVSEEHGMDVAESWLP